MHHGAQAGATDDNLLHTNALEAEVKLLRILDTMREDRDA